MSNDNGPIPEIQPSWIGWFIIISLILMLFAQIGVLLMAYEATGIINGKRAELIQLTK